MKTQLVILAALALACWSFTNLFVHLLARKKAPGRNPGAGERA